MKLLLLAGMVGFLGVTSALAAPVPSASSPGIPTTILAAGTYNITTEGTSGGGIGSLYDFGTTSGGMGAVVGGIFTFVGAEALMILVGAVGGLNSGCGGGTFVVGRGMAPWSSRVVAAGAPDRKRGHRRAGQRRHLPRQRRRWGTGWNSVHG